jgi:ABC-type cobalt transport system substrate-binding protein
VTGVLVLAVVVLVVPAVLLHRVAVQGQVFGGADLNGAFV